MATYHQALRHHEHNTRGYIGKWRAGKTYDIQNVKPKIPHFAMIAFRSQSTLLACDHKPLDPLTASSLNPCATLVSFLLRSSIHILQLTFGHSECVPAPTETPTLPAVRRPLAMLGDGEEAEAMRRLIACEPIMIVRTARGRAAKPNRRATTGDWSTYVCY